jgi:hypothetical protein
MSYYELWNVLWNWKKEFTAREFSSVFVSPDPNKVLHDMAKKGLLEKVEWGRYKVSSPEEYLAKKVDIYEGYELVKKAGLKYAFTGPDAVFFWTKGGYQVDRFFGFYPVHVSVKKADVTRWREFFKSMRKAFWVKGEPVKQTLFGVFYVLYIEADFEVEQVEGFYVAPLEETVTFCKESIYSYEPALEMLDEMYNLGLKVKYREAETNF